MSRATLNRLAWCVALALLVAWPTATRADVQFILTAPLFPTDAEPLASGGAQYLYGAGYHVINRFAVRVRDISSTDTVLVLVNDEPVGMIDLTDGRGRLVLEPGDPNYPRIENGDDIEIVDPDDGTVLLEGTFGPPGR
jgi:hypothetical protein